MGVPARSARWTASAATCWGWRARSSGPDALERVTATTRTREQLQQPLLVVRNRHSELRPRKPSCDARRRARRGRRAARARQGSARRCQALCLLRRRGLRDGRRVEDAAGLAAVCPACGPASSPAMSSITPPLAVTLILGDGMFALERRVDPVHDLAVAVGLHGPEFQRLAGGARLGSPRDSGKSMNWPLPTLPSGPVHVQTICETSRVDRFAVFLDRGRELAFDHLHAPAGDVFVVNAREPWREQHVDLLDIGAFLLARARARRASRTPPRGSCSGAG